MKINEGYTEDLLTEDAMIRNLLLRVRPEQGFYSWAQDKLRSPEFIETRHLVREMFSNPVACDSILSAIAEQ